MVSFGLKYKAMLINGCLCYQIDDVSQNKILGGSVVKFKHNLILQYLANW